MIKKRIFCVVTIILLLPALFLHGCLLTMAPVETSPEIEEPPPPPAEPTGNPVREPPEAGQFTLRYDSASTMNPITSLNRDHILLSSLMYESLFTLDSSLNVSTALCESWSTADSVTYEFVLKPDIAMRDGSYLTADDVVYTLRQAMQTGRFVNRLEVIRNISTDSDLTVTIMLKSPNSRFIRLLDVPIIKDGSIDDHIPPGTGPYVFSGTGRTARLTRFPRHRDYDRLPVSVIHLIECDDNEVMELFDGGELSLLWDDPSGAFNIRFNRLNEPRYYDTTALQYIGFNTRTVVLYNHDVRRAIGCAIDRNYIANKIMPGQTVPAPLALSPVYRWYDPQWEERDIDPLIEMSALLVFVGLEDFDSDSYLEYPDGFGGFFEFTLDFIVNSENAYKVQAAHRIADALRRTGFDIVVRELPWENFKIALQTGDFDMYYGEILLSADFDLSPLLLPESSINYGRTGSSSFFPLIENFLSAQTAFEERETAKHLCEEIRMYAPFVPILYKKYAIFTPIGAVTGASPSQSGVFYGFTDWTIDMTMLS